MKSLSKIAVALSLPLFLLFGFNKDAYSQIKLNAGMKYSNEFIDTFTGSNPGNGPHIQRSFNISYNRFNFGFWSSRDQGFSGGHFHETDIGVDYQLPLSTKFFSTRVSLYNWRATGVNLIDLCFGIDAKYFLDTSVEFHSTKVMGSETGSMLRLILSKPTTIKLGEANKLSLTPKISICGVNDLFGKNGITNANFSGSINYYLENEG